MIERRNFLKGTLSQVLDENEKGVYLAGDCTGCEKPAREIRKEHLDNAYKMGLEL